MSAAHDLNHLFLSDSHWVQPRAKTLSVQAFRTGEPCSVSRSESAATAAYVAREAISVSGASRARLAKNWGHGQSRMARKLDPSDHASVTLRDVIESRHGFPRFFHEIVRQLSEMEAGEGEAPRPAAAHALHAQRLMGALAHLAEQPPTKQAAEQMDRVWAELASIARQARRDLRKGA